MENTVRILLVEDDPDDIELMQSALDNNQVVYHLETIKQGDAVLPYLEKVNAYPDVIVLDLNLPKMHGREVLKIIKSTPHIATIPIVILTTSSAKKEIDYCLENGAAEYLIKPVTIQGFNDTVTSIVKIAQNEPRVN